MNARKITFDNDISGSVGVEVAERVAGLVRPVGEDVWVRVWRALDALGAVLGELFDQEEGDPADLGRRRDLRIDWRF